MEEQKFEKQILKMITSNIETLDDVGVLNAAKEITSHVKQFHDWLEQDNTPNAFEKNYDYWLKNVKK